MYAPKQFYIKMVSPDLHAVRDLAMLGPCSYTATLKSCLRNIVWSGFSDADATARARESTWITTWKPGSKLGPTAATHSPLGSKQVQAEDVPSLVLSVNDARKLLIYVGSGPGGRWFESNRPDQPSSPLISACRAFVGDARRASSRFRPVLRGPAAGSFVWRPRLNADWQGRGWRPRTRGSSPRGVWNAP
jgi:hypothetical protein